MNLQAMFRPALTIEELVVNDEGFTIRARKSGIFAALGAALGIGTKSHLTASFVGTTLRQTSLAGEQNVYVPHGHVTSSIFVLARPVWALVLAAIFALGGLSFYMAPRGAFPEWAPLAGLFLGLILVIAYRFLAKTVLVGVVTAAGTAESIKVEASPVHLEELRRASAWLERRVSLTASPLPN